MKKQNRINIADFPEYYRKQIEDQLAKVSNRNTRATADRKPGVQLAKKLSVEIHEGQRFINPVRVHFHSIRHRLPDLDNLQGKAVLDAIVKAGILPDDRPQWIPERPTHTAEIGKDEKTIITIETI